MKSSRIFGIFSLILALLLCFSMAFSLCACDIDGGKDSGDGPIDNSGNSQKEDPYEKYGLDEGSTADLSYGILDSGDENADDGSTGKVYVYNENRGKYESIIVSSKYDGKDVVSIYSSGFNSDTMLKTVSLPNTIKYIYQHAFVGSVNLESINLPDGLLLIDMAAFEGCESLSELELPSSLTTIGERAFAGSGISSAVIPEGVIEIGNGAFKDCKNLKTVVIPGSVENIPADAFAGCTALESVVISDGVKTVEWGAFSGCTSLASVAFSNTLESIGERAFEGCVTLAEVTLPENLKAIYAAAFAESGVKNIVLPDTLEVFGELSSENFGYSADVFFGCTALESVDFGAGAFEISGFSHCTSLKNIDFGENKTIISESAFFLCTSLSEVVIPEGVIEIGGSAFRGCPIEYLTIPSTVETFGYLSFGRYIDNGEGDPQPNRMSADIKEVIFYGNNFYDFQRSFSGGPFSGVKIDKIVLRETTELTNSMFSSCQTKEIVIPDTVTTIRSSAFFTNSSMYGGESLELIKIPEGVTNIEPNAFSNAWIKTVEIPATITVLPEGMFRNSYVEKVVIHGAVEAIPDECFYYSQLLTDIYIPSSVKTIGARAFYHVPITQIDGAEGVISMGDNAFEGCQFRKLTLPPNVETLGNEVFRECVSLREIHFPASLRTVGNKIVSGMWGGLPGRNDITVTGAEGLASYGEGFYLEWLSEWTYDNIVYKGLIPVRPVSKDITYAAFKEGTVSIPERFFDGCSKLMQVYIPAGCEIGEYAFINTTLNLQVLDGEANRSGGKWRVLLENENGTFYVGGQAIVNGEAVTLGSIERGVKLSADGFAYVIDGNKATIVGYPTSPAADGKLVIPATVGDGVAVAKIDTSAFSGLLGIKTVIVSAGVTDIGTAAFAYCSDIEEIVFEGVKSVGIQAFYGCTSLSKVTLGGAVEYLRAYAFAGCTSLSEIVIPKSVLAINPYVFDGCTSLSSVVLEQNVWYILSGETGYAVAEYVAGTPAENAAKLLGVYKQHNWMSASSI